MTSGTGSMQSNKLGNQNLRSFDDPEDEGCVLDLRTCWSENFGIVMVVLGPRIVVVKVSGTSSQCLRTWGAEFASYI